MSIEIYVHFRDGIKMMHDVFTSEKLSYRPFDWSNDFLVRVASALTAGVKFVNMAADCCMFFFFFFFKFLIFYCLVFSPKYFSKDLKKFLKCSSEVWKVKISFITKIFCYLFRTFVHDRWFDSRSINTYLVNFMISVLI